MRDSIDTKPPSRSSRVRALAVAAVLSGVLVAACGSSSSPSGGSAGGVTSSATTATTAAAATTTSSTSPAAGGLASPGSTASGPLAFSRCMRANGVPSFPDPSPGRGQEFNTTGLDPSSPAFREAQAKCGNLLGAGPLAPGSTTHPSAQTLGKLLKIARCMRQLGVPQFPDPQTTVPANPAADGDGVISDFDGAVLVFPATLNLQAPAYRKALTACGAPPLGLQH